MQMQSHRQYQTTVLNATTSLCFVLGSSNKNVMTMQPFLFHFDFLFLEAFSHVSDWQIFQKKNSFASNFSRQVTMCIYVLNTHRKLNPFNLKILMNVTYCINITHYVSFTVTIFCLCGLWFSSMKRNQIQYKTKHKLFLYRRFVVKYQFILKLYANQF